MFRMKAVSIALLVTASLIFVNCLPHKASSDDGNVKPPSPAKHPPEFVMDLYHCWRDREVLDSSNETLDSTSQHTKECLLSAGEDDVSISDILLADKVMGFEGQVIQSTDIDDGPEYLTMSFNLSCTNPSDKIHSSELRIHKHSVSQAILDTHKSDYCNLNDRVNVALLADIQGVGTGMHIIQMQTLTHADLLESKWMRFHSLKKMFVSWMSHSKNKANVTLKLVFLEGCAGINPQQLGFLVQGDVQEPMLLAFQESMGKKDGPQQIGYLLRQDLQEKVIERRRRGNSLPSQSCTLQELTLSFDDIQLKAGTQVIVPSSYRANYCQGNCRYPIPSFLNASLHAEIQSYLHFKNPDEIPNPCCIATELISLVVLERLSNWTIQTAVYDNIAATKCGCV